ncbi:MAG: terpene cyclase/mutase family protein [Alphaproteobacteria bacterium]|nr:terpene cyclase/mutase family protein [Clostridia bacterium]MBQ7673332.1 terpene cyclase/mutase family protein [Alphaproteobacteria bacterium]
MEKLESKKIENAIKRGANYLFLMQNPDGGIKYQDEKSTKSGIWVTAEALEFFLSSKVIQMTAYEKVVRMIDFIVKTQDKDGAWSVIPNDVGMSDDKELSAITTGHCVFVLKMALVGGNIESGKRIKELRNAIKKGEAWLRQHKREANGLCYWGSDSSEPQGDLGQRMECIFMSYYAVKGFLNPDDYAEDENDDQIIIARVVAFFNQQADFFINTYAAKINTLTLGDFAKISSTICRILRGLFYLGANISHERREGLKKLLESCSKSPLMTSSIRVSDALARQYTATYNNNTPFDMAIALIILETNITTISEILNEYLNHQDSEGFWYLNFSDAYDIKTWSTAEALLVLEKAFNKYNYIALDNEKQFFEEEKKNILHQIESLEKKNNSLRTSALIAIIISIALSVMGIIAIAIWSGLTPEENKNKILTYVLDILIVPLVINILSSVIMALKNSDIIKSNNQKKHVKKTKKMEE